MPHEGGGGAALHQSCTKTFLLLDVQAGKAELHGEIYSMGETKRVFVNILGMAGRRPDVSLQVGLQCDCRYLVPAASNNLDPLGTAGVSRPEAERVDGNNNDRGVYFNRDTTTLTTT